MIRAKFIPGALLLALTLTAFSGCSYFWPGKGDNEVFLPPEVIAAKNSYYSEPVKLGSVIKTKKISVTNIKGSSSFFGPGESGDPSFYKGDTGSLSIFVYNAEDPDNGKYISYKAQVTSEPEMGFNGAVINITENYDKSVVDGASGEFTVVEEKKEKVIAVPKSAVKYYFQKAYVGVLKNGTREDRLVQTGLEGDETVEIKSGLSVGEAIVFN